MEMEFPEYRPRRTRKNEVIRKMIQETTLSTDDFILPYFVIEGSGIKKPIPSMKGHYQLSIEFLLKDVEEALKLGISSIILFGIPLKKDSTGSEAFNPQGVIQNAVIELKKEFKDSLYVITDICLCEYTDHGHCGVIKNGEVHNDETLKILGKIALSHAESGVDMVAPSGMMDGMVEAIREALDEEHFENIAIMAYSAKYASGFYGPFREAAQSAPKFGDRKSYQMPPQNFREALREVSLDIEEGADIIMVKPAMPYLDVIKAVKDNFLLPVAAFQVSGEFAMIKAAAKKGWLEHDRVMLETLYSIKRAGADLILTYFAKEAAKILK